jgi:ubiquinone/menaquinone biosynthesis C-methylase UbiE
MDAGCGSGMLTKELARKVPRGRVYAVDIDSNMIRQARDSLQFCDNVEIIQPSFTDIKLRKSWMSFFLILHSIGLEITEKHFKPFGKC